jgi:hypothetical protein
MDYFGFPWELLELKVGMVHMWNYLCLRIPLLKRWRRTRWRWLDTRSSNNKDKCFNMIGNITTYRVSGKTSVSRLNLKICEIKRLIKLSTMFSDTG